MSFNLSTPIIYCISEGDVTARNFVKKKEDISEKVRRAAGLGIGLFQIREKELSADHLFELVRSAVEAAGDTSTKVLVNSRFDIAMAAGAHGVHLPSDSIPAGLVRQNVRKDFIVGVSAHSLADVEDARSGGADFAVIAPVFQSPGKSDALGLDRLGEICSTAAPFPAVALGGIEESNKNDVLLAGASGYAAIRYLNRLLAQNS